MNAAFRILAQALTLSLASQLWAAPEVLWSIGKKDNSGAEFGAFGKHEEFSKNFPGEVRFEAGKSSDSQWPFVHPGPEDKWAQGKPYKFSVEFSLSQPPTGDCQLVVNAVSVHEASPLLEFSINGTSTSMLLGGGKEQMAITDEKRGSAQRYALKFSPSLLHAGKNEISLTSNAGSWLLYDELHLESDAQSHAGPLALEALEQNPCWIRTEKGESQALTADVRNLSGELEAVAVSQVGGESVRTPLKLGFGQNRVEIPVPAVEKPSTVTLTLEAGKEKLSAEAQLLPQRKWKIFVVPSVHTDIGYTNRQPAVFERHNSNLDTAMEMLAKNPEFAWNAEVAFQVTSYLNSRPYPAQEKLLGALKSGRIGLQAGYLNFLTAMMSDEAMNRYAYAAAQLRRGYGINYSTAVMTDIPTACWGLCSTLAGSGVRYFAEGCNSDRGPMLPYSGIHTPFYWEAPDGERVLTLLTDAYAQSHWLCSQDIGQLRDALTKLVKDYEKRSDYPYDALYVYGAFLDNLAVDKKYGTLLSEWKKKYAYPEVTLCDGSAFFRHMEEKYGASLPVLRGDFGAYWEDGAGSSAAETIMHMESQRRITQAETLFALAKLHHSAVSVPVEVFQSAWDGILFYAEHTWGAAQSIGDPDCAMTRDQWAFKADYAHRAERETKKALESGLEAYVKTLSPGAGELVVVNTLSWPRGGLVALPETLGGSARLVDENGVQLKTQKVEGKLLAYCSELPGFGARSFKVVSGEGQQSTDAPQADGFENAYYRVKLDAAKGLASIVDKESGKELVDQASPYAFGQIVYAGGGEETRIMQHSKQPEPEMAFDGCTSQSKARKGAVVLGAAQVHGVKVEASGPLFTEAVIRSSAPSMENIETRVRLYNTEKRISFDVRITSKSEVRKKEAVYVAFPFALSSPEFRLGMTKSVADPAKDFIHGACHEWYCVQDFVACRDGAGEQEVVWSSPDAPLVTLSQVNCGKWPKDACVTSATIFSYVMNNYWHTNYKAGQDGDFRFRYELSSSKAPLSNEQCLRFARETATPLLCTASGEAKAEATSAAKAMAGGVQVEGQGVLATLKQAESGQGTVVRLRNSEAKPAVAKLRLAGGQKARFELTNLTEDVQSVLQESASEAQVELKPQQTVTVRVR